MSILPIVYTSYATPADIEEFTGIPVATLPSNIGQIIRKASDLITNMIKVNILPIHSEALKLATSAQVEYWLETGDQSENNTAIKSYTANSVSVTYADKSSTNPLCPRAKQYLNKVGLLYAGVKLKETADDYL